MAVLYTLRYKSSTTSWSFLAAQIIRHCVLVKHHLQWAIHVATTCSSSKLLVKQSPFQEFTATGGLGLPKQINHFHCQSQLYSCHKDSTAVGKTHQNLAAKLLLQEVRLKVYQPLTQCTTTARARTMLLLRQSQAVSKQVRGLLLSLFIVSRSRQVLDISACCDQVSF